MTAPDAGDDFLTACQKNEVTVIEFAEIVGAVRARVDNLIAAEPAHAVEGPSFVWDPPVARWRIRHLWATAFVSPETGQAFGNLLVLGRDANLTGPFGAQSTPIPFSADSERVESVARAIAGHFAWPA